MTCFIGIDIGTTHTKAVIINEQGDTVFDAKKGYDLIQPQPGHEEQDAVAIMQAVEEVMAKAFQSLSDDDNIGAVSFSAAMHSIMPVDKDGQPLHHALIWADTRSNNEAKEIAALPIADELISNTGIPLHPMSPLCKIVWFKNNQPDIFSKAYKFISIKEYVLHQLFGKYIVDHSVASATGLFNTREKNWDEAALQIAGISHEKLSQLVSPLHAEYELTARYKEIFQLKGHIPFVIGASDGCLANIGSGAVLHGDTALTIGTSGAVRTTLENPSFSSDKTLFTYVVAENIYVRGGAINNGGIVLKWLTDLFEQELSIEEILEMAAKADAGANGLVFLPYLLGERAPVWDADAKGAILGLTVRHRKEHIARAALEGICFVLKQLIGALEKTSGVINEIYVSGGFVQSSFWIQLLADVTGKKLNVTDSADASAIGAAYMGMFATGQIASFAEMKKHIPIVKEYYPHKGAHEIYNEIFGIFNSLYPKLKEDFSALSRLNKN